MKRTLIPSLGLAALLVACGGGSSPNGGRDPITPPVGTEADLVKFEAVPNGAPVYLALLDSTGAVRGQIAVAAGATRVNLSVDTLRNIVGQVARVQASSLIPTAATEKSETVEGLPGGDTGVVVLELVMYQDANTNSALDTGETLPRMTHDRLLFAEKAFTLAYRTANPDMKHSWTITGGVLTRAEHDVYKAKTNSFYQRSMTSAPLVFELHFPTPETSL